MDLAVTEHVNPSGLVVAAVGFALTRVTVLGALDPGISVAGFLIGDAPALVAGFGLTVFGFLLTVSADHRGTAPVIARWCLLGVASMAAVVGLTAIGSGGSPATFMESRLVSNVLVGGAVGGTLTGVRSAGIRRHRREAARTADRLTVLNRILRHEVLNKVNVIEGYATTDGSGSDSLSVIERNAEHIGTVIEEVDVLTGSPESRPISVEPSLSSAAASVRAAHPDATVTVGTTPSVPIHATARLELLFEHLLENAVVHDDDATPTVRVEAWATDRDVRVRIVDEGPGLPAVQRRLVEEGTPPEMDDPRSGFGLAITRLIADDMDADLSVETPVADGHGTAVTVSLRRVDAGTGTLGIDPGRLRRGVVAGVVAGVGMGLVAQFVAGQMAVIGALYGVDNVAVGWVSHLFHSVVFALVFVVGTTHGRFRGGRRSVATVAAAGTGYGIALWLVAAGIVMPLWLRAVGVTAPVPNLQPLSLAGHLVWGCVFGGVFGWLDRRVVSD
jgi:signal transduction histidine kinase